jgi:N-acetylneuraminic acid mutarotase
MHLNSTHVCGRILRSLSLPVACLLSLAAQPALAHFPWLIVNEQGKPALFFGEGLTDTGYKLPETMKGAKILAWTGSDSKPLTLTNVDSDSFVGLVSEETVADLTALTTEVTYGIYNGNRLQYYASHIAGALPKSKSKAAGSSDFGVQLVDTDSGVDVFVTWKGKPLSGVEVHLYCSEGHEEGTSKTNAQGKVSFSDSQVEDGLNGLMLGHTVKGDSGKFGDESFESTMHYYTVTFTDPETAEGTHSVSTIATHFDELPFEITSFGAARVGNVAYVYGGHTGDAHSYSVEEQSNQLLALDLTKADSEWQVVSTAARLQGLGMVPYRSSVIIVGGFSAKNERGEDHDLHSQAEVKAFDTTTAKWTDLPPLPAGRSSHDACILDDTIYVIGGWDMRGEDETQWHTSALSLNLSDSNPKWKELPTPPFQRRALATVAHDGRIYVIGGMDKERGPTKAVSVFDPQTQSWSSGPALAGEGRMAGFGAAAWSVNNQLIVSTYEGEVLRLDDNGKAWDKLGKTEDSRFFHRLIPLDSGKLVSVGGANMEEGKYLNLEILDLE